jgi:hypothetical protein
MQTYESRRERLIGPMVSANAGVGSASSHSSVERSAETRFDFAAAVLELDKLTNLHLHRDNFVTRFSCCKPLFRLQNELIEHQRLPCYFSWNHDILAPLARCQSYSCESPPPSCGPCIRSWVLPVQAGATWSCKLGGWQRGGTTERCWSACAFQQGHIHGRRRPEERFRVRRG